MSRFISLRPGSQEGKLHHHAAKPLIVLISADPMDDRTGGIRRHEPADSFSSLIDVEERRSLFAVTLDLDRSIAWRFGDVPEDGSIGQTNEFPNA